MTKSDFAIIFPSFFTKYICIILLNVQVYTKSMLFVLTWNFVGFYTLIHNANNYKWSHLLYIATFNHFLVNDMWIHNRSTYNYIKFKNFITAKQTMRWKLKKILIKRSIIKDGKEKIL